MAAVIQFHRRRSIAPPFASPTLGRTCERIQRAIGLPVPLDLRRRLEHLDSDQLNVVQIVTAAAVNSGLPVMHLLNVAVDAIARGAHPSYGGA